MRAPRAARAKATEKNLLFFHEAPASMVKIQGVPPQKTIEQTGFDFYKVMSSGCPLQQLKRSMLSCAHAVAACPCTQQIIFKLEMFQSKGKKNANKIGT